MTEQIQVQVATVNHRCVVAVFGEIDIASAPVLRATLDTVIRNGIDQLVVDLDGVEFMDSTGLNALVGLVNQLSPGSVRVVAGSPHIRKVFSITGLDQMIALYPTVRLATRAEPST